MKLEELVVEKFEREHRISVLLPVSYIQGLIDWIGKQISKVGDEMELQELRRQERELRQALDSYKKGPRRPWATQQ